MGLPERDGKADMKTQQTRDIDPTYFCINHGDQTFFLICHHSKCIILNQLFPFHLNTYVMDLQPFYFFQFFQHRDRLYTSESDVHRRQILTSKDFPRAERVDIKLKY